MDNNYREFQERRKKRRNSRALRRATVLLSGTLVVLLFAWIGVRIINEGDPVPVSAPASVSASQLPASQPPQSVATSEAPVSTGGSRPALDNTDWNIAGPIPQATETMQLVAPDYRMIALPENGRVAASYFDTVTFVGDSITQGLQIYNAITNATYCAYKSISPRAIYDGSIWKRADGTEEAPMDAIIASQPDNVYILLGANAMGGMNDDLLLEYYREMLNRIRDNLLPGVGIYIQSVTPVSPTARFSMERINELNNRLAQLAYEESVYFIDLNEPLAGDDGYLRPEFDSGYDGMHMTPAGYAAWVEYLVTHTAYHPRNPYLVGSPYQTPTPADGEV